MRLDVSPVVAWCWRILRELLVFSPCWKAEEAGSDVGSSNRVGSTLTRRKQRQTGNSYSFSLDCFTSSCQKVLPIGKDSSPQTPNSKFSAQRRFICPRWTEHRQSETKTGARGWGEKGGTKGEEGGVFASGDKELSLDREETQDVAIGKWQSIKVQRERSKLG